MTQEPSHVRQGNTMNGKTFEQEEAIYAVRAYRAIEGEVRYSDWPNVKAVKVK